MALMASIIIIIIKKTKRKNVNIYDVEWLECRGTFQKEEEKKTKEKRRGSAPAAMGIGRDKSVALDQPTGSSGDARLLFPTWFFLIFGFSSWRAVVFQYRLRFCLPGPYCFFFVLFVFCFYRSVLAWLPLKKMKSKNV